MDAQGQNGTLNVDGRNYDVKVPAGYGPAQMTDLVNHIRTTPVHQSYLKDVAAKAQVAKNIETGKAELNISHVSDAAIRKHGTAAVVEGAENAQATKQHAEQFGGGAPGSKPSVGGVMAGTLGLASKALGGAAAGTPIEHAPPNLVSGAFERGTPGITKALDEQTGLAAGIARGGAALLDPVNIVPAAALKGVAATAGGAKLLAGAFGGQTIYGGAQRAAAGDPWGGLGEMAVGLAPFAGHVPGTIKDMPSLRGVTDMARKAVTEHPVSGGGIKMDLQRAFGNQIPETEQLAPNTASAARQLAGAKVLAHLATEQTHEGVTQVYGDDAPKFYQARDKGRQEGHAKAYTGYADGIANGTFTDPVKIRSQMVSLEGEGSLPKGSVEIFDANLLKQKLLDERNSGGALTKPAAKIANKYEKDLAAGKTVAPMTQAEALFRAAADDTANRHAWKGTQAEYDAFIKDPKFQEANDHWDRGIGRVYGETHAAAGGLDSDKLGEHGYFPGIARDADGKPGHYVSKVPINDEYRGNFHSTGLAERYEPVLENLTPEQIAKGQHPLDPIKQDLYRKVRSAAEKNLWDQARAEGLAKDIGSFEARPTVGPDGYIEFTNPGTGEVVKANIMDKGLRFIKNGEVIPPDAIVTPEWFRREIQPLIQHADVPQNALRGFAKALGGAAVTLNPADLLAHGSNLVGGLEMQSPGSLTNNPLMKMLEVAPLPELPIPGTGKTLSARKLVAINEMRKIDLKSSDRQAQILRLAREGVLPDRLALPHEAPTTILGRVKQMSHNALSSMDLRARLIMDDSITRFEQDTGVKMPAQARFEAQRSLGIYSSALEGGIERWQKTTGLNPFATAHMQQMRNGFKSWLTLAGVDHRYAHLPLAQRLSAKAGAQLRGGPLKKMLAWYLTAQVAKQILAPQKGDEKFMRAGGAQVASPLARGPGGAAIAGAYNAHQADQSPVEGAALGVSNTVVQTALGNLGQAGFSGLTGKAPYLVPGKGNQGPNFVSTIPKGIDNNVGTRAYYGLIGLNQSAKFVDEHLRQLLGGGDGH